MKQEKASFWRFGDDWFEHQRINEAAEEINQLSADAADIRRQLGRLFELDRDQGKEIARLQATVMALVELVLPPTAAAPPPGRRRPA